MEISLWPKSCISDLTFSEDNETSSKGKNVIDKVKTPRSDQIYIYIYIYIMCVCVYTYVYIHIHIYSNSRTFARGLHFFVR